MNQDFIVTTKLLDEGIELHGMCPQCHGWICELPNIKLRKYQGKRSIVKSWECWNCKIEYIQVYLK